MLRYRSTLSAFKYLASVRGLISLSVTCICLHPPWIAFYWKYIIDWRDVQRVFFIFPWMSADSSNQHFLIIAHLIILPLDSLYSNMKCMSNHDNLLLIPIPVPRSSQKIGVVHTLEAKVIPQIKYPTIPRKMPIPILSNSA